MTINPKTYLAYELFHNGALALSRAEQAGIRVDVDYVQRKKTSLERKMLRLEEQFKDTQFFHKWEKSRNGKEVNIKSSQQLRDFIYNVLKLHPPKFTETSTDENPIGSTDKDSLRQLNIPELNILLERNDVKKCWDVLDGFEREQVSGYMHPNFNLNMARTFRSSSNSPNFQNIPVRDEWAMNICRGALFPRLGHQLLEADFKGIEVGVSCCYNHDPVLIDYVSNPKSDMHGDMAKQLFKIDAFDKSIPSHAVLRQAAKNGFVFPEFYGSYYGNCAVNLACEWGKLPKGKWRPHQGIDMVGWEPTLNNFCLSDHMLRKGFKSLDDFTEHVKAVENDFWNNRFAHYQWWKDTQWELYKKYGYIDLHTGFRCSGVMDYKIVNNYPIQGSAFHCLLWTLIELDKVMRYEEWDSRIIGQIHDSIIMDINPSELEMVVKTIKRIATEELPKAWKWIVVPLSIDISVCEVDRSWSEKDKYKG